MTPNDIIDYLKDTGNAMVSFGAAKSFIEKYNKIMKICEAWEEYCRQNNITARKLDDDGDDDDDDEDDKKPSSSTDKYEKPTKGKAKGKGSKGEWSGYETSFNEWLNRVFPGTFISFRQFKAARAFYNKMILWGAWEDYETMCNKHCVFTEASMDHSVVFAANLVIMQAFKKVPELEGQDLACNKVPLCYFGLCLILVSFLLHNILGEITRAPA